MPNHIKRTLLAPALIACLVLVQSCGSSKVVIGRAEPKEPSAQAKTQEEPKKVTPKKTEEKKTEKTASAAAPEPKKASAASGSTMGMGGTGMMGMGKPKPAAPEAAPTKVAEVKATDSPPVDTKAADTKAADTNPSDTKAADTNPSDTKAADTKPPDATAQEPAAPQSSPAPPRAAPPAEEKPAAAIPSPYKLDLSFGGFGLGVGLFDNPASIAVDDLENIYVVDQGNYRVEKFDRFGIFQFAFGRQGMGDGEFTDGKVPAPINQNGLRMTGEIEFNKPIGMLLDKDDTLNLIRIHIVDSLNNRIQRLLLLKNAPPVDKFPSDIFILLTSSGNSPDTILEFGVGGGSLEEKFQKENKQVILAPLYLNANKANPTLLAPFIWGGLGFTQGQLNNPTYLTKDDNNILWVSDTENGRVEGFYITPGDSRDATFYREFGNDVNLPYGQGRLSQPTAIAFSNAGFGGFLVLDKLQAGGYSIQKFDRDGHFTGVFSASGDNVGQFKQPVGIAVNPSDNTVFITDRALRKVLVYNNKGEFMYEFGGDELADPRGITVLRNNFVYVTDAAKNMVYRYVPQ